MLQTVVFIPFEFSCFQANTNTNITAMSFASSIASFARIIKSWLLIGFAFNVVLVLTI